MVTTGPIFHKTLLPTYDEFHEDRYFEPGCAPGILELNGFPPGHQHLRRRLERPGFLETPRYHRDPIEPGTGGRASHRQSFRVSFIVGKETTARKDAGTDGPQARASPGLGEPGRRQ